MGWSNASSSLSSTLLLHAPILVQTPFIAKHSDWPSLHILILLFLSLGQTSSFAAQSHYKEYRFEIYIIYPYM